MTTVRELLKERQDQSVWSLTPDMTVLDALKAMAEHNVGAMPVLDGDCLVGVYSERDYARNVVVKGAYTNDTLLSEAMVHDVVTVTQDETLEDCMRLMSEKHIRHLPVVEDCKLVGHFSIRDLMQWFIDQQKDKIDHLQDYIEGSGYGR
jgi:CBS domain-containing protein